MSVLAPMMVYSPTVILLAHMTLEPLIPLLSLNSIQAVGVNVRSTTECSVNGLSRGLELSVTFSPTIIREPLAIFTLGILSINALSLIESPLALNRIRQYVDMSLMMMILIFDIMI